VGHYVAGLAAENDTQPQSSTSIVPVNPVELNAEPRLAESIAAKAQIATNPVAADHFAESANKLQEAHEQDKAWLERHPEHPQTRQ